MASYPDSVRFLYSIGNEMKGAKLGLGPIKRLLAALGDPQLRFQTIHVAGTNGKGSTCAMIAQGLWAAGRKTGLYTSPHLIQPTERIQLGPNSPISPTAFAETFARVHETSLQLIEAGELEHHPSYFESVTAMGFLAFADAGMEWAVIETGLGGRLDATNVLLPALTVITPIAYDHQEFLGNTLALIAAEKAGILKTDVPALIGEQPLDALEAIIHIAEEKQSPLRFTHAWQEKHVLLDARGSRFLVAGPKRTYRMKCRLPGEHQVGNAATAVAALEIIGLDRAAIEQCGQTAWPGRLERVSEQPEIILDGAHNLAGAEALARYMKSFFSDRRITLIFGVMRDKDVQTIAELLFPLASRVIVTAPHMSRAMEPEALRTLVSHPALSAAPDLATALGTLQKSTAEDVVFITGSLYLVGEAREKLCPAAAPLQ